MASQRKIEANRANLLKSKGLTPEGRERLRQAARRNRPWEHSTGPRTPEGKARCSLNAMLGGCETADQRGFRLEAVRLLRAIADRRKAGSCLGRRSSTEDVEA